MEYQITHIPEYNLKENMVNRLCALVRLEQFLDERTITWSVIEDLQKIVEMADERNECRISTVATLILEQYQRYFSEEEKNSISPTHKCHPLDQQAQQDNIE